MTHDYADCIHALLRHENISSCIMLGHSMGGYITLAFAEKYPLLLTGLGLIHSTAFADSEEKKKNRARALN
jgi:pimeloyl-ACP methyl ester carboxylesterase